MTTTIGKSQGRRGVCIRYVVVAVPCAVHPLLCSVQLPVFRSKCDRCALQSSVSWGGSVPLKAEQPDGDDADDGVHVGRVVGDMQV